MQKRQRPYLFTASLCLLILFMPFASAQTYSGFAKFSDNIKLFFSKGENKVPLALEIREKEVNSAINNIQNQEKDKALENLERAKNKLQIVQERISLDTSEEVKMSVKEIINKIDNEENLSEDFELYVLEEEKTSLTAELTEEIYAYCKELSKEDFGLMLTKEECNPKTASEGLKEELQELKQIHEKSFNELMLEIRSCIDDPGTCNCEANIDIIQKAKCEKMVALAVKCEYKDDENACGELISLKPVKGDGFAESFVPDFLLNLFIAKENMIDYEIEHSDEVPPECYNENERVKTQCAVFREKKELSSRCFDENGNFLLEECGGPKENTPTMQESIPQCYDEKNNFLEEKCGKVTIIWNEEGLINYIFEEQLNNIIEIFENASEKHVIDMNNTVNKVQMENNVREIKEEMNQVDNQILERTYAPGTSAGGESGVIVEGGEEVVTGTGGENNVVDNVISGNGNNDGGEVVITTEGDDEGDSGEENEVSESSEGASDSGDSGGESVIIE